jgi:hypothetical protein
MVWIDAKALPPRMHSPSGRTLFWNPLWSFAKIARGHDGSLPNGGMLDAAKPVSTPRKSV